MRNKVVLKKRITTSSKLTYSKKFNPEFGKAEFLKYPTVKVCFRHSYLHEIGCTIIGSTHKMPDFVFLINYLSKFIQTVISIIHIDYLLKVKFNCVEHGFFCSFNHFKFFYTPYQLERPYSVTLIAS